ncbi:Uncharacterised protein [Mycobacteroides abscessus subsp. bolletii]|nr:Uncharacterised protein [Mycobacteroides abscessus subsp. bolletii]
MALLAVGAPAFNVFMLISPVYRDCVCFVYGTFGGEPKPVGTAFFLGVSTPPVRWLVVVTALHVVANIQQKSDDGKTYLRVNTKDGGFRLVEIEAEKWMKPDVSEEVIDIAFCQWESLPNSSEFDIRCVGSELAATPEVISSEQIGIGNEVAFAGLFVRHHGKQRNEPIMRFGNICAMPTDPVASRIGEIEAYLVESRSVGGLSGSPVFVDVGLLRLEGNVRQYRRGDDKPALYLLGVVQGHWDAPIESAPVDKGITSAVVTPELVNMGIAVVTPISKVFDVIDRSLYGKAIRAFAAKFQEAPPTLDDLDEHGQIKFEVPIPPDDDDEDAGTKE